MRILFVTNEIPFPPDNGVRIVSYHAMRMMHEAGHELALAVLSEESGDLAPRFAAAAARCQPDMAIRHALAPRNRVRVQLAASFRHLPFFVERYRSTPFSAALHRLIAAFRPDAIHFDIITLAQYVALAPAGAGTIASINDSNALTLQIALTQGQYRGVERHYRKAQLQQVRRYESTVYPQFDAVHLMSDVDAAYLKELNPSIRTVVIPNGADDSLFSLGERARGRTDIIFVAKLVGENLAGLQNFLESSWPLIEAGCRDARLHIVGALGEEIRPLQARFGQRRGIVFHGYVEKLADLYQQCGIAIVPINKDCGILNKVIEAMAAGLAVVGFSSAFAGIREARGGAHCLIAEDYPQFAAAALELLRDPARLCSIQKAAQSLAQKHYTWATRAREYENMYRNCAQRARAKRVPTATTKS